MFGWKRSRPGPFAVEGFGILWRPPTFHALRWSDQRPDHLLCTLTESSDFNVVLAPGDAAATGAIHPFEWGSLEAGFGIGHRRGETGAFVGWPREGGKELVRAAEVALGKEELEWRIVTPTARVPIPRGFYAHADTSSGKDAVLGFNDEQERGIAVMVFAARESPPPDPRLLAEDRPIVALTTGQLEVSEEDEQGNPTRVIYRWFERGRRWHLVAGGAVLDDRAALVAAQQEIVDQLLPVESH